MRQSGDRVLGAMLRGPSAIMDGREDNARHPGHGWEFCQ